jgi:hypothetical protein
VASLSIPGPRVMEIVKNRDILSRGYASVQQYAAFHTKHGQAFVDLKGFIHTLEGVLPHASEKPEIEGCVSRYKGAILAKNIADPAIWSGLTDSKQKAELALRELSTGWKEEARTAAFEVRSAVMNKSASLQIEEEFAEGLLSELGKCSKTIDEEIHPTSLATLSGRISALQPGIIRKLEEEYKRRHPDPAPGVKEAKIEKIKVAEFITKKRIVTSGEWETIRDSLDKRVKDLLDQKFEVELE